MTSPMTPFLLRAGAEGDAIWSKDHWIDLSSYFYQILNVFFLPDKMFVCICWYTCTYDPKEESMYCKPQPLYRNLMFMSCISYALEKKN